MHYIKLLALIQSNYIIKKQTLFTASSISIVGLQNAIGRRLPDKSMTFRVLYGTYVDHPSTYIKHVKHQFCYVIFKL